MTLCKQLLVILLALPPGFFAQSSALHHRGTYVLGPEDLLTIRVRDLDEYNPQNLPAVRVDPQGDIRLPLLGRLHVAGSSIEQLEAGVAAGLSKWMKDPEVTVSVTEFGSRPVSVLGAVRNPGVHQVSGHKTLLEVLSLAGGLAPDAGNTIKITRRKDAGPLPLDGVVTDPSGDFLVGVLNVRSVMEAKNPQVNIEVLPNDVITVPKAELVYVVGAVKRSGGFVLNEKEQISVLQAVSMAEGLDHVAAARSAKILRSAEAGGVRTEVPIDLRKILEGAAPDVPLRANDILFVPDSKSKSTSLRALEAAVQMGTGIVIWRL